MILAASYFYILMDLPNILNVLPNAMQGRPKNLNLLIFKRKKSNHLGASEFTDMHHLEKGNPYLQVH